MNKYLTVVCISFIFILLSACGQSTYEVDEEVSVEFEGYDEHGKGAVSIDKDGLFHALSDIKELDNRNEVDELESLIADLDIEVTPNENLKNGDEIEFELLYDEENSLDFHLELKNPKITVEELEPIHTLSEEEIFAGIDIHYEGISPFLNAEIIENSSSDVSSLFHYSIPDKSVENDEEIQITAEPNTDLILSGYQADEADFTKTITVSSEESYVEKWDELNSDDKNYVLTEIQDIVTAKVDAEIQEGMNGIYDKSSRVATGRFVDGIEKSEQEESYFLFAKEGETSGFNDGSLNGLRFVYKNKVTFGDETMLNQDYVHTTKDYFSVVEARNLIIDNNGNLHRDEVKFSALPDKNLDKETVKNDYIYKVQDSFTMDALDVEKEANE